MPTTGNEYPAHQEAKWRIFQTMVDLGFKNVELEKSFQMADRRRPFIVDCYGEFFGGAAKLAVEILGEKGHNTKYAYHKDRWRKTMLEERYRLRLISLSAANLGRDMPDKFVEQELLEAATR